MWWIHWLVGLFGGSSVKSASSRLLLLSTSKVLLKLTNWLGALLPPLYLQCNYFCHWGCVCSHVCLAFHSLAEGRSNILTDFSHVYWKMQWWPLKYKRSVSGKLSFSISFLAFFLQCIFFSFAITVTNLESLAALARFCTHSLTAF